MAADAPSASRNHLTGRVLSYVALGLAVILVLFPIYWMVAESVVGRTSIRGSVRWPCDPDRRA